MKFNEIQHFRFHLIIFLSLRTFQIIFVMRNHRHPICIAVSLNLLLNHPLMDSMERFLHMVKHRQVNKFVEFANLLLF